MTAASQGKKQDHPLDLIQFLKALYEAGRISKEDLQLLVKSRKSPKQHVLVFIAEKQIEDLKNPGKTLDLESLTQILAEHSGQDYYHVDPLSINAAKLTEVMSHAFAKRHQIMAVKVDDEEVTIASAEPDISAWEEDLLQVVRKPIKRVVTNPLELDVPSYLTKAAVIGVMAQRLVQLMCPHCKEPTAVDKALWGHLDAAWEGGDIPEQVYESTGCRECRDTGFHGREGIYEVMPLSETLQSYAEDKADLPKLRQQAYSEGMSSLRHSGALKVAAGITMINEVFRVAPESH